MKIFSQKKGFTLIEMILALSIFVLTVLVATSAYMLINRTQRRTVSMQKVQDDVRYLFEAVAQDVRLGKVNYDFYNSNSINLYPTAAANTVLAVFNQSNEQVFYRRSTDAGGTTVQYCKGDPTTDCKLSGGTGWTDITPTGVTVLDLRFIITPSADPMADPTTLTCLTSDPCAGDCLSYQWNAGNGRCEYYTDGGNYQPKVRIILKTRAGAADVAEQADIDMQTTISSRILQGRVLNNYHD